MASDPIHQFQIQDIFPLGNLAGHDVAFTTSAAYMALTVVIGAGALLVTTRARRLIPDRGQMAAELLYELIANTLRRSAGEGGMRFFPLVFSLFLFILVANLIGMFPYAFTVTSQIIVTGALALLVFAVVTLYGLFRHGFGFLGIFMPKGIPMALAPIIVPIEIISYISRPISHAVRLFAVILAGHVTLKVFTGFVAELSTAGPLGVVAAVAPLLMAVGITALEFLMAIIQAYVFTMLTCMYLNDAVHPNH